MLKWGDFSDHFLKLDSFPQLLTLWHRSLGPYTERQRTALRPPNIEGLWRPQCARRPAWRMKHVAWWKLFYIQDIFRLWEPYKGVFNTTQCDQFWPIAWYPYWYPTYLLLCGFSPEHGDRVSWNLSKLASLMRKPIASGSGIVSRPACALTIWRECGDNNNQNSDYILANHTLAGGWPPVEGYYEVIGGFAALLWIWDMRNP